MPYVKTQPHLQRKGVAYYRSSTPQTVTAVGQTLNYAFQIEQFNNTPNKIIKISDSVVQLKGGSTYRVTYHVLGYHPSNQFSVAVALYNTDTDAEITTGLESVSFSTTYTNHEVPSAPGEYILSPTSDLKITCKVKYLNNQMNIGNTSFRIMIEELEVYTPQAVSALSCTSVIAQRSAEIRHNATSPTYETVLRVGHNLPVNIIKNNMNTVIGLNARRQDTSWVLDTGSTSHFGATIIYNNTTGDLLFRMGAAPGAEGQGISSYEVFVIHPTLLRSMGIYNTPTSNGPNVFVDGIGILHRSTSSIKYKRDVEDLDENYSKKIYELRPVWYRSRCERDKQGWSWYGLVAEEVAKVEPRLCTYNKDGEPEGVDYARLSVLLLKELQLMRKELDELKNKEGKNGKTEN